MPKTLRWRRHQRFKVSTVRRMLDFRRGRATELPLFDAVDSEAKRLQTPKHDYIDHRALMRRGHECQLKARAPVSLRVDRVFQETPSTRRIRLELPNEDLPLCASNVLFSLQMRIPELSPLDEVLKDTHSTPPLIVDPVTGRSGDRWMRFSPVSDSALRGCLDVIVETSVPLVRRKGTRSGVRIRTVDAKRFSYLDSLREGSRVLVRGPYSRRIDYPFVVDQKKRTRIGLICSGMGLTNVVSLLKEMCFSMDEFEHVSLLNGCPLTARHLVCASELMEVDSVMNHGSINGGYEGRRPASVEQKRFRRCDLTLPLPTVASGGTALPRPSDYFSYNDEDPLGKFRFEVQTVADEKVLRETMPPPSDQTVVLVSVTARREAMQCCDTLAKLGYSQEMVHMIS